MIDMQKQLHQVYFIDIISRERVHFHNETFAAAECFTANKQKKSKQGNTTFAINKFFNIFNLILMKFGEVVGTYTFCFPCSLRYFLFNYFA